MQKAFQMIWMWGAGVALGDTVRLVYALMIEA